MFIKFGAAKRAFDAPRLCSKGFAGFNFET
jgi:hypothetical protein